MNKEQIDEFLKAYETDSKGNKHSDLPDTKAEESSAVNSRDKSK